MPDLHPRRIPEFVKPSRVDPDSKGKAVRPHKAELVSPAVRPGFTGSDVKDLGRIAAGR